MKLVDEKNNIAPMIAAVTRGVGKSPAVLGGVLLDVGNGVLTATATDLDLTIRAGIEVGDSDDGAAVVPGRLLEAILKSLPPGPVTLETTESGAVITAGTARFTVRTFPVSDFPTLPAVDAHPVYIAAVEFCRALRQVVYAASADSGRPVLTGVLLSTAHDVLRMVATDTYRMVVRDIPDCLDMPAFDNVLIPSRALMELARLVPSNADDDIEIILSDISVLFGFQGTTITSRLLDGTYPAYEQLIPEKYEGSVTLNRSALLGALDRMVVLAGDRTTPVRLDIQESEMGLSIRQNEVGNATETIPIKYPEERPLQIAFNPRYLAEAIEATESDEIKFSFVNEQRPCVLRGVGDDDYMAFLMPVRVL